MKPVVVLVGRPNVGKSTLFNRCTRSRDALVADIPGLTRDRHYGEGRMGDRPFLVVDTGGFEPVSAEGVMRQMARQTLQAIDEADVVIFVLDGRLGLAPRDREIGELLRRCGRPVVLTVNKLEGQTRSAAAIAEFHELGLGEIHPISAAHGDGVVDLFEEALNRVPGMLPDPEDEGPEDVDTFDEPTADEIAALALAPGLDAEDSGEDEPEPDVPEPVFDFTDDSEVNALTGLPATAPSGVGDASKGSKKPIRVAIIGRPNVGKSTLINALIGEERVIAFDQPGTTRDAILVPFERAGRRYELVDTAGIRRRGKVTDMIEKFSVIKTLQAVEQAHVVVLMLDAKQDISDQDAHIAGYALESGRAMVVAINKWDGVDLIKRDQTKRDLTRKLQFLSWAKFHFISALHGHGVQSLLRSIEAAYLAASVRLATPKLTRALQESVQRQQPPRRGQARPKMRYAHQGGQNPPLVVIHGNSLENIPEAYRRYLETRFRETFSLHGTPLRVEFRTSVNPFASEKR